VGSFVGTLVGRVVGTLVGTSLGVAVAFGVGINSGSAVIVGVASRKAESLGRSVESLPLPPPQAAKNKLRNTKIVKRVAHI
jgi:hypothetical protein